MNSGVFPGVTPELVCGDTHTQKNLRYATSSARGEILDGAEGISALLNVLESLGFHFEQLRLESDKRERSGFPKVIGIRNRLSRWRNPNSDSIPSPTGNRPHRLHLPSSPVSGRELFSAVLGFSVALPL